MLVLSSVNVNLNGIAIDRWGGGGGVERVEGRVGGWLYEEGNGNTVIGTGFLNCFFRL